MEPSEAAVRHEALDARLEERREHRVVSAERVADAADAVLVHFGQRLQHVHRANVVVDRLHAAACVAVSRCEVERVFAEARIVRRERDVTALSQMQRVIQVRIATESGRLGLADVRRLMQAQDRRDRLLVGLRQEQKRFHATLGRVGVIADLLASQFANRDFFLDPHVEQHWLLRLGKRSHDGLHPSGNVLAPLGPLGASLDRLPVTTGVEEVRQVLMLDVLRNRIGSTRSCRRQTHAGRNQQQPESISHGGSLGERQLKNYPKSTTDILSVAVFRRTRSPSYGKRRSAARLIGSQLFVGTDPVSQPRR